MQQQALVYAQQALAMARRLGDPELLATNLQGMIYALQGPEHAQQRLAYATEMLHLAEAVNDQEPLFDAHWWRVYCLVELGDMPAADAEINAYAHLAEEAQQPFDLCLATGFRAMRALMQGRFADSERLAQEALAIGQRLQTENAAGIFGLQMFTLRREQGRLKELEPVVRYFVQQHSVAGAWRPGLALIYSELGRTEEARAEFEHLAQHDFTDLPRDALWMAQHDVPGRRLHLPGGQDPCGHLVPAFAALRRTQCRHWQCRGLLRRPLPLPGGVSHHSGTLGRSGAALRGCSGHERPHGGLALAGAHPIPVRHYAPGA